MDSFSQNLYLWLDILTLLGPLILSFDKKVAFFKNWKPLFLSILIMMLVFIPWDIAFTKNGVWGFNPDYLCGLELFNLPVEEWLFFIVVPYACVFIFECCRAYFEDYLSPFAKPIFIAIALIILVVGLFNYDKSYTVINFLGAALMIAITLFSRQKNIGYFLLSFLISLLPFLLINGVLTGSFIDEPIVWYNNEENLGIRIFSIPLEDSIYLLFFFLLVLVPYEKLRHHS